MSARAPIHLLDGGLGTTLADNFSVTFDASKPLWSSQLLISAPETLLAAQKAFVESGADVLLTVTYQASFEGFARSGIVGEGEAEEYMRSAVGIAREGFASRGDHRDPGKVALSLGAYGATMIPGQEYSGKYDEGHVSVQQLREWHLRRLQVFLSPPQTGDEELSSSEGKELKGKEQNHSQRQECRSNVDLVAFETLPLLREVEAVRLSMGDLPSGSSDGSRSKPFWICCVFPGEDATLFLPDGSTVKDVVKAMIGTKHDAAVPAPTPMGIGFNCTKITKSEALVLAFEDAVTELIESGEVSEWPALVLYPDGTNGEVYNTTTQVWEKKGSQLELSWDETLSDIVSRTRGRNLWKSIYVGGCCKTTPVEIGRLRERIDRI